MRDATECPGNVLYGELPAIRAGVRRLAPNPTRATLVAHGATAAEPGAQATPEAVAGAGPAVPRPARLRRCRVSLELLDGSPVSGAPVLIQARTVSRKGEVVSERTLAETTTDSDREVGARRDAGRLRPAEAGCGCGPLSRRPRVRRVRLGAAARPGGPLTYRTCSKPNGATDKRGPGYVSSRAGPAIDGQQMSELY